MASTDPEHGMFSLKGKVAVVTGGGSGLGSSIALGFADAGATVVIADVDDAASAAVVIALRGRGADAVAEHVDVTVRHEVESLADAIVQRLGRVDVLVNSAGTAARYPAEDFPEDEWDRVVTLNLKGTFLPCQAIGRKMLVAGSGSIVNLASIGSTVAYPHSTAYLQSKGGVAQLTRSLAIEWIGRGVRVNAIAPGLFDTPLVRASDARSGATSEWIEARTPIGRRGEPSEIVGPAVFLASDASSMVTGHLLHVDGGYAAA